MYTSRTPRGFGLHDTRICFANLDPVRSSYTQTGGRTGSAIPIGPPSMFAPRLHHAQENDLRFVALRAGSPGRDQVALGYRVEGEPAELTRGWNEPNVVEGYEPIDISTTRSWIDVDSVSIPGSQVVVAIASDASGSQGPTVWRFNPVTGRWRPAQILESFPGAYHAGIVRLSSGRILVYRVVGELQAGTAVWFSDDDGETWARYADPVVPTTFIPDRIRLVEDRLGNVLLLATKTSDGDYEQLASGDGGVNFAAVDEGTSWGVSTSFARTVPGQILLAFCDFASDSVVSVLLEDATDLISLRTPAPVGGLIEFADTVACVADADGTLYIGYSPEGHSRIELARSIDNGTTFVGYSGAVLGLGGDVADVDVQRHQLQSLAASGGSLIGMVTPSHPTVAPATDGSLLGLILGGWTNVEMPGSFPGNSFGQRTYRSSFGSEGLDERMGLFLPSSTLAEQGWAHSGTAATRVAGYHRYDVTAGTSFSTVNPAIPTMNPWAAIFEARAVEGGDVATDEVSLLAATRDGTNEYRVRIRISPTGFRVRDDHPTTPANLGTVTRDMVAQVTQFFVTFGTGPNANKATVFWRELGSVIWNEAAQATLLPSANVATLSLVRVGMTTATTAKLDVGMVGFTESPNGYPFPFMRGLADDGGFLGRLRFGKALGTAPYPMRDQVDGDRRVARVSASGGVAHMAEEWTVRTEWDYGVRDLDPVASPSSSVGWRSRDATAQVLCWDLGRDSRLGSSWLPFLTLVGANFRTAVLEYSTDADPDVWVELGTYNAGVEPLANQRRGGDMVRPAPITDGTGRYYGNRQLAGGTAVFDPQVTPIARRIVGNGPGYWSPTGVQAHLQLEGITGSEPTSGEIRIFAPAGTLVMRQDAVQYYRRLRLRIPAQPTAEGHFRLGKVVLGAVTVIGRQWSRGFSMRYVPVVRESSDDTGIDYVEPTGLEHQDSVRREFSMSFQDGYTEKHLRNGTAPYIAAGAAGLPLVGDQDVRLQLAGFLRESKGGSIPSVVILEVPPVTFTIADPELFSYGRLRGTVQSNNVQGREGRDEVYRVESLTHTEL